MVEKMFKRTFVQLGFFSLSKHCPTSQCEQSHSTILSNYLFCCNFTKSFINIVFNRITRKIECKYLVKGVKILIELLKGFHPTVAPALTALNQFPSLVNEVNHIESILSVRVSRL